MASRARKLLGLAAAPPHGPSFRDFVLRAQVLQQYAAFHRTLARAGLWQREDLRREVRTAFRFGGSPARPAADAGPSTHTAAPPAADYAARRSLLDEGARQLATLRRQLGVAQTPAPATGFGYAQSKTVVQPALMGTEQADDSRYRVGAGWPWGGEGPA